MASFWNTIGSVHQSPMFPRLPRPGVSEITKKAASVQMISLTP